MEESLPAVIVATRPLWTNAEAPALFQAALTRRAFLLEQGMPEGRHHEPLEWLGDRVLDMHVVQGLWHRFPFVSCYELDVPRSVLCGGSFLADRARELRLAAFIRMGKGEALQGQAETNASLSSHFEALVGAAWLAGGWSCVTALLDPIYEPHWPDTLMHPKGAAAPTPTTRDARTRLSAEVNRLWRRNLEKSAWEVELVREVDQQRVWVAHVTLPDGALITGPPTRGKKVDAKETTAEEALVYIHSLEPPE